MNEYENHDASGLDQLFLVHVPALVAVLLSIENEKGRPLTEAEVVEIRDSSECIAMPLFAKKKIEESRGYIDINPENAWEEWKIARSELADL
ncbi:hypothetical protein [uncultured Tolumonas sp.]|uniref:hypothetical protein n=1 Tax=uncultured Tolumonas sp. TaxID=263765 RepID=UPI002931036F|nr:hypothetical protein [uncultured Tolumonas sp.]